MGMHGISSRGRKGDNRVFFFLTRGDTCFDISLTLSGWGFSAELGIGELWMIFSTSVPIRLFLGVLILVLLLEEVVSIWCLSGRIRSNLVLVKLRRVAFISLLSDKPSQGFPRAAHCICFYSSHSLIFGSGDLACKESAKVIGRHRCSLILRYLRFEPHSHI